jgi:cyclase
MMKLLKRLLILIGMAALPAAAQYTHQQESSANQLDAQLVKTGLFLFSSGTSNTLLRLTPRGLVLVDGQPLAYCSALSARVRKISDQPVVTMILTDQDDSHMGCNARMTEARTQIAAQDNLKQNLLARQPPPDKAMLPVFTFDREYALQLSGIEVRLLHFGNAHSNADTVVYFPNLKVVAVGDLFAQPPNPDFSAGGSLLGWGPVLDQILKLDFDVVVPGSGPTVKRADLEAFKAKLDTLVSRASALVKKGVPKDQFMSQLKTDDLGWQLNFSGDIVDHFYAELSKVEQSVAGRNAVRLNAY